VDVLASGVREWLGASAKLRIAASMASSRSRGTVTGGMASEVLGRGTGPGVSAREWGRPSGMVCGNAGMVALGTRKAAQERKPRPKLCPLGGLRDVIEEELEAWRWGMASLNCGRVTTAAVATLILASGSVISPRLWW
jgi:hypothetical protein